MIIFAKHKEAAVGYLKVHSPGNLRKTTRNRSEQSVT
jgi:hypothetical protein